MCPLIATRGASLDKDDLTCGLKTDQLLHMTIATEYNTNSDIYSGNAHPYVGGCNTDASIYDDISWQKSKKVFTELTNEYDKVFYNWKKSGFHGDIPVEDEETGEVTVPGSHKKIFSHFVHGNCLLLYMHRFVFQFPECLEVITGE